MKWLFEWALVPPAVEEALIDVQRWLLLVYNCPQGAFTDVGMGRFVVCNPDPVVMDEITHFVRADCIRCVYALR